MDWLTSLIPNIITIVGLGGAIFGVYRKVMKAIKEQREALDAVSNVQAVFKKAYKDGNIDNKDLEDIEDAINNAIEEGKDVVEAWKDAGLQIKALFDKSKK